MPGVDTGVKRFILLKNLTFTLTCQTNVRESVHRYSLIVVVESLMTLDDLGRD